MAASAVSGVVASAGAAASMVAAASMAAAADDSLEPLQDLPADGIHQFLILYQVHLPSALAIPDDPQAIPIQQDVQLIANPLHTSGRDRNTFSFINLTIIFE